MKNLLRNIGYMLAAMYSWVAYPTNLLIEKIARGRP